MNTTVKKRDNSIDILKCLAALIITNSHMEILYPHHLTSLATGGAIGDVSRNLSLPNILIHRQDEWPVPIEYAYHVRCHLCFCLWGKGAVELVLPNLPHGAV